MTSELIEAAGGYTVGELIRISCEPESARVVGLMGRYVLLQWPWRRIDAESRRARWNGEVALPRNPEHFEWRNTPWRVEPGTQELKVGDSPLVGITPITVRITQIRRFDPAVELGWLPRPELSLGACFLGDEDDPEAGFPLYLPTSEPIVIERP